MYQPRPVGPFGDIYSAATPEINQASRELSNHLWMQQQQRQMFAQREAQGLDSTMNREFARIKAADIPDFTNAYQDWKSKRQNILFNKQLQRDPVAYNNAQADTNAALAKAMQIADESAQEKNRLTQLAIGRKGSATHDLYNDDFESNWTKAMNTPTSQLKNTPLAGNEPFLYQGGKLNLQAADKIAQGSVQPNGYEKVVPVGQDGLQEDHLVHKFGANAAQYKQSMLGYLANNKGERGAAYTLANIDPSEIAATHNAYMNQTPEEWQAKTGKPVPIDVSPTNPNNKSDVYTSYLAEKSFLNRQPVVEPVRRLTDAGAKMQQQKQITEQNQANQAGLARGTHAVNRDYDVSHPLPTAGSQAAQNGHDIVEDAFNLAKRNATANPDRYRNNITHPDGTKEVKYELPIDQEVRNKLARLDPVTNKKIVPVKILVSEDGQTFTPIFYSGAETKEGKRGINTTFSVPMPRSNFDAVVGDVHKSKSQAQPTQKVDVIKLRSKYNY